MTDCRPDRSPAALWASAAVLAGLILVQAGRVGATPSAPGDAVSFKDFTLLTADGGTDDVLLVIDSRSEQLYVFHIEQQSRLELIGREDLRALFATARVSGAGRP